MRLATFSSVAVVALLLLGTGQAARTRFAADLPFLDLYPANTTPGHTAATEADLYMPAGKQMAKVVLYVPAGYGNVLGRAPNTEVGEFAIWDPSFLPSFGFISADDPAAYPNDPCSPGLHQAVWSLTLEFEPGDLPQTQVLIDATTGSETALGAYKAQLCIPAASATKIRELDLYLSKLTNPAARGAYTWRAFVTPYSGTTPNDAGTFELRGTIPMPTTLTLHGRYDRKHKRALLTGRLTTADYALRGVYLDLYTLRGGAYRYSASTKVNTRGYFSMKRRIKKTTRFGS